MGCLLEIEIVRYLAGDLSSEVHREVETHLDHCAQCTGAMADLVQRPEARADLALAAGGSGGATDKMPQVADQSKKAMWLERLYRIQIGDVLNKKYRIERILGEGGMGIVLAAMHLGLRERVALKFMHPSMVTNESHTSRFIREARAAVKLRDENVAQVLDLGELDETGPFIVMEYLDGEDLLKYLKVAAPLSIGESVELIRQTGSGVAVAHDAGIVHRDLKPGNIFMTKKRDGRRVLKVLDFGVSKFIEGDSLSVTSTNMVVGSPMYMAPEMFESARNASPRSDVWALGVIFYRMLTGKLPFLGESLPEMVAKIHFGQMTPITHWRPELPHEIVQVIDMMLTKNPKDRFSSAREFLNALAQLPASVRSDSLPSITVSHLTVQRAGEPMARGPGTLHDPTGPQRSIPIGTISSTPPTRAPGRQRHTLQPSRQATRPPWVFAVFGALASAALLGVVWIATSTGNDNSGPPENSNKTIEATVEGSEPGALNLATDANDAEPDELRKTSAVEKAVAEKIVADKAAADKVVADKAAADKVVADMAAADKVAADKAAADKVVADKAAADKAAADKVAANKAAADKAAARKAASDDKIAARKAASDARKRSKKPRKKTRKPPAKPEKADKPSDSDLIRR